MPDSDWLSGFAPKLIIGLAVLLALAVVIVGWRYGESQQVSYEHEAKSAHEDYSKHACYETDNPQTISSDGKKPDGQPCVEDEKAQKKNDNRRDYDDLVAQRSSALWAKIMGIAALIGVGLSAIGVILVWTTFKEARRTADYALEQMKAGRAWITLRTILFENVPVAEHDAPGVFRLATGIKVVWNNTGATPARDVSLTVGFAKAPINGDFEPFDHTAMKSTMKNNIGPGGELMPDLFPIFWDEIDDLKARTHRILLYHRLTYRDIFDHSKERVTEQVFDISWKGDRVQNVSGQPMLAPEFWVAISEGQSTLT